MKGIEIKSQPGPGCYHGVPLRKWHPVSFDILLCLLLSVHFSLKDTLIQWLFHIFQLFAIK